MQTLQLLYIMDARRVVPDTGKGLVQSPRHPGGFYLSSMLVLAMPECAGTVGRVSVHRNTVRRCARLSVIT